MPSNDAFKTGLFYPQCGQDKPADQLRVLFALVPSESGEGMEWRMAGRYCLTCIPGREDRVRRDYLGIEIKFEYQQFTPRAQESNSGRKVELD